MSTTLTGMQVAVLVTDGFEQIELSGPLHALQQADAAVKIISDRPGPVQGLHQGQRGECVEAVLGFVDADPLEFDAVLLPGGSENGKRISSFESAQHFVQQMDELGKPIAAICHGTLLLAAAGLLEGRTLTSWPGIEADMRQAGGRWVDEEVVVDGNLLTSRKPDDVPAFSQRLVDLLFQRLHASIGGTRDEHPEIGPQG